MTDQLLDIAATADELTEPRRHVETISAWDGNRNRKTVRRVTTMPSLLNQLATAIIPGEVYVEEETGGVGSYESRPPAYLDAINRLLAIEIGAARWCWSLKLPMRDQPDRNIRSLVGAAGTMDSDTQRALLTELRTWWAWAATVTGWHRPPDAPRAPCPICDRRGTLRVRLDRHTGCCMQCGAGWDATTIGLLADHVRGYLTTTETENKAARARAVELRRQDEARRSGAA